MSTEAALELDVTTTAEGGVEVHFSNFPGLWQPGRPIAISDLGFTTTDAAMAAVNISGLPLRLVDVPHGSAPAPARDNHVANEEQARAIALATSGRALSTHKDLDEAAQAAGVEWPVAKMTVSEKTEFLHTFQAGIADEDGTVEGDG